MDDFLAVARIDVRNAIDEEISRTWKIKVIGDVSQFDIQNPEMSLKFLSTTIRSHPTLGGFTMSQEELVRYLLKTWEMSECRPFSTPGEASSVELPEEGQPHELDPDDI